MALMAISPTKRSINSPSTIWYTAINTKVKMLGATNFISDQKLKSCASSFSCSTFLYFFLLKMPAMLRKKFFLSSSFARISPMVTSAWELWVTRAWASLTKMFWKRSMLASV